VSFRVKNPLKKSGSKRTDRRETLEQEAAEKIRQVGSQPPPEVSSASTSWVHPAPEAIAVDVAPSDAGELAPSGRRLTVQERMATRTGS